MENRIKEALDLVTAEQALKEHTAQAVTRALKRRERPRAGRPWAMAAAAACLVLLLTGAGSFWAYFTPVATISVDVNPSLELDINRFDRVIQVEAFNLDGQEVADSLELRNLPYLEAMELLMNSQSLQPYLEGEAVVSITVLGETQAQSDQMLQDISSCSYAQQGNVYCHTGHHEDVQAAREAGLSLGKYEAYLELYALDPTITPQDVQGLTMYELRQWLQDLQQGVHRPDLLLRLNQLLVQGVGDQLGNGLIPFHAHPSSKPWGWLLCQAQAEATMVFRSLYLGFQPSTWMAFSEEAMS